MVEGLYTAPAQKKGFDFVANHVPKHFPIVEISKEDADKQNIKLPSFFENEKLIATGAVKILSYLGGGEAASNEPFPWLNENERNVAVKCVEKLANVDLIKVLEKDLLKQSFLTSKKMSNIVDLFVCGLVYDTIVKESNEDRMRYCATTRWFDFVQNMPVPLENAEKHAQQFPVVRIDLNYVDPDAKPKNNAKGSGDQASKQNAQPKQEKDSANNKNDGNKQKEQQQQQQQQQQKQQKQQQGGANKQKPQQQQQQKGGKGQQQAPAVDTDIGKFTILVGKILQVDRHPDAEKLYVSKIEVGEKEPRTIVSGLVDFVPIDQMKDRLVVIAANLKPITMRGVASAGMVLCATDAGKTVVEPIVPPNGAAPGDRVVFADLPVESLEECPKKIVPKVLKKLQTNAEGVACYGDIPFTVANKGVVTAPTLKNGPIS